ncbi:MAG: helix-turn-helix transcriptional regulator [Clostridia bacterium]|nr:helix-turn-helix transcriptional regulator [Clostridia bacterium]
MNDIKTFCTNIKKLRNAHHLTQKEMAALLKIGVASLRKLEQGSLPPRMTCDIIFHIDHYFGINPAKQFEKFDL